MKSMFPIILWVISTAALAEFMFFVARGYRTEPIPAASLTLEEVEMLKQWTQSEYMQEAGRPHRPGAF